MSLARYGVDELTDSLESIYYFEYEPITGTLEMIYNQDSSQFMEITHGNGEIFCRWSFIGTSTELIWEIYHSNSRLDSIVGVRDGNVQGELVAVYNADSFIDTLFEPDVEGEYTNIKNYDYTFDSGNCTGNTVSYNTIAGLTIYAADYEYTDLPYTPYVPRQYPYNKLGVFLNPGFGFNMLYLCALLDIYAIPANDNLLLRDREMNYEYQTDATDQVRDMYVEIPAGTQVTRYELDYH